MSKRVIIIYTSRAQTPIISYLVDALTYIKSPLKYSKLFIILIATRFTLRIRCRFRFLETLLMD